MEIIANNEEEMDSVPFEMSDDAIRELLVLLKKERTISYVATTLEMSELEVLGLVHLLVNDGYNIIVKQYDDGIHLKNQGDFVDKDMVENYKVEVDLDYKDKAD